MKKLIAAILVAAASAGANAATAIWTGKIEFVTTVTFKQAVRCQYNYLDQLFWVTLAGQAFCPGSYEVE
ncbi:MAG: hypothetical protein ABI574_08890 [Burkholderiales bacterium]